MHNKILQSNGSKWTRSESNRKLRGIQFFEHLTITFKDKCVSKMLTRH